MIYIRLFFTFILSIICGCLLSQSFRTEQLLTDKDLPFREVIASFEDKDHIIWMVQPTSICRNTGSDIECFDYTLQGAESAFMVDDRYIVVHNIVKSTLGYFDIKTRIFKPLNKDGKKDIVYDINIKQQLYFTDNQSIYKYNFKEDKYTITTLPCPFQNTFPSQRFTDGKNTNFQVLRSGLLHNGKETSVPIGQAIVYWQIAKVNGQILINNGRSILNFNEANGSFKIIHDDNQVCKKIFIDTLGNIILNLTKENICKYSKSLILTDHTFKNLTPISQFHQTTALDSTLSHVGGYDFRTKILISSYHGFLSIVSRPTPFKTLFGIEKNEGFGTIIKGMTRDHSGNLYFSSETNYIFKQYPDGHIDTLHISIPIGDTIIKYHFSRNIYVDPKTNFLWGVCGSYVKAQSVLFAINLTTKRVEFAESFPVRIWSFLPYDEKLILSTNRDVIFSFDLKNRLLDTLSILPNKNKPEARILYQFNDQMLIGGKGGLYAYNWKTKSTTYLPELDSAQIYTVAHIKNILWVGTLEGVWLYNLASKKIIKKYDKSNGLSDNYITAIIPMSDRRILVATFHGINLIDLDKNLITPYYAQHGISDNEFNFISHFQTKEHAFLGSINGATVVDKALFKLNNDLRPKLSKTETFAFNANPKTNYDPSEIIFDPDDQKVIIHLMNESCTPNARFAYRIIGVDSSFVPLASSNFELLRPNRRNQKIEFICTDGNGIWSDRSSIIHIKTKQHFYLSAWFYSLLTLLSGLVIFLISKWRIKEIRNNEKAITEMNRKMSEQKLLTLQSQMNPHFLFNTMSSLQYLIQTKNTTQADNLLTSFGVLMRMILESSKTKYWSLREEIKMLKLYCELEKERFDEGKIKIIINEDEIISTDIQLPPMIIQPFVENVFNHAFTGMDSPALLEITFVESDQNLKIIIKDNGIGIKNAAALKSAFQIKKSRGLEITQERIENYNYENQGKITFSSQEAINDSIYPGTLVTILINKRVSE